MYLCINTRKAFQYFYNLLGATSLTFALPYILFRVARIIYLKRKQMALAGKFQYSKQTLFTSKNKSVLRLFAKVVVITGASSGLGEALSHEFYKHGCQVVLCARRRQELDRVRTDLLQMYATVPTHPPIIMPFDLSDLSSHEDIVQKILKITDHIDILVNNGGISHRGSVFETNLEVHMKIMAVNYFGAVALTKAVLPQMMKRRAGHIISVSSVQGLIALPHRSAYSASKHALQAFSDSLRAEVADYNIYVTVVSPGYIKTSLSINALTESGDAYGKMDDTTEGGYSPEYVAEYIVKAIVQKKEEVVVSSFLPKLAIMLRKCLPWLYFFFMARRARNAVKH